MTELKQPGIFTQSAYFWEVWTEVDAIWLLYVSVSSEIVKCIHSTQLQNYEMPFSFINLPITFWVSDTYEAWH